MPKQGWGALLLYYDVGEPLFWLAVDKSWLAEFNYHKQRLSFWPGFLRHGLPQIAE